MFLLQLLRGGYEPHTYRQTQTQMQTKPERWKRTAKQDIWKRLNDFSNGKIYVHVENYKPKSISQYKISWDNGLC